MTVGLDCKCGQALRGKDRRAGTFVQCTSCGRVYRLPDKPGTILPVSAIKEAVCAVCGRRFSTEAALSPTKLDTGEYAHRRCCQAGATPTEDEEQLDGDVSRPVIAETVGTYELLCDALGPLPKIVKAVLGVAPFESCSMISSVAFSPKWPWVATAATWDDDIRLWSADTAQHIWSLQGHYHCVQDVAFSPQGKKVASASADGTARIWDVATGTELLSVEVTDISSEEVRAVAFSSDGKWVCAGFGTDSEYGGFHVFDAETGKKVHGEYVRRRPQALEFSPDGTLLAVAGGDDLGIVTLWDLTSRKEARRLESGLPVWVDDVTFSPDGKLLASAQATCVFVWGVTTGRLLFTLEAKPGGVTPDDQVRSVAFGRGGSLLASSGYDGALRLWSARSGELLRTHQLIPHRGA